MEDVGDSPLPLGAILFTGAFVLIFALVLSFIVRRRRRTRAIHQRLISLGYEPVPTTPSELFDSVTELYRREGHQELHLNNIFHRSILGGELWVFDLIDAGGDETTTVGSGVITVISPDLDLPRLVISPIVEAVVGTASDQPEGVLTRLASKLIDWAASTSGLERLGFQDTPAFHRRYLVLAEDETAARAFLTWERRDRLAGLERSYEIMTKGNALAVRQRPYGQTTGPPDLHTLELALEDAKLIFDYLR